MALSNIRKEPRREITESLIGMVCVAGALWLDYAGSRFVNFVFFLKGPCPIALAMILLPIVLLVVFLLGVLLVSVTHGLGEVVCGRLAKVGFDPRPKVRK